MTAYKDIRQDDLVTIRKISLFILVFLQVSSDAMASKISYECPSEIHTEQSAVKTKVPSGWLAKRAYNFEPQLRTHMSVYDGPPEQGASLIPDDEENTDITKTSWSFGKKKERSIWLACEYTGTGILLTKELPKEATLCRLLLSKTKTPEAIGFVCK